MDADQHWERQSPLSTQRERPVDRYRPIMLQQWMRDSIDKADKHTLTSLNLVNISTTIRCQALCLFDMQT